MTAGNSSSRSANRLSTPVLVVTVVLALATVVFAAWGALRWTLIPERLDATVAWSSSSKDGHPWHELVFEGGTLRTIDTELLERMGPNEQIHGQHIEKEPWSRTLVLGDRSLGLAPSRQFWRSTVVIAVLAMVGVVRFVLRYRTSRRSAAA